MTPQGAGRQGRSSGQATERIHLPPEGAGQPPWAAVLLIAPPNSRTTGAADESLLSALATSLSERGILAAIEEVDGSVAKSAGSGPPPAPGADPIASIRATLRRLASRTDICVDGIGLVGHGVGGLIAAALAGESKGVAGVCLIAPPLLSMIGAGRADDQMPDSHRLALAALDPFASLAGYPGPTLLVHGAADRRVPLDASHAYRAELEAAGRPVEQILVALGDHDFSNEAARADCLERIVDFFEALVHRAERATA